MPDTDSPPDSYTERNKPGIIKIQNRIQHIYIPEYKFPLRIILLLPSVIIFSAYTTHIVKDIVQKRLLVTVMRVKRNSADLCLFTEFRNRNVFKSSIESILIIASLRLCFVLMIRLSSISGKIPSSIHSFYY